MSRDEDRGVGDPEMFSAEDLERLYRLGAVGTEMRISGATLNRMLGTKEYQPGWYVVTNDGVRKL